MWEAGWKTRCDVLFREGGEDTIGTGVSYSADESVDVTMVRGNDDADRRKGQTACLCSSAGSSAAVAGLPGTAAPPITVYFWFFVRLDY